MVSMTRRSTRIIGVALTSAALAFTFLLPVASAQRGPDLSVDRNCVQVDDSQGNCVYQTANPSADQGIFQVAGDAKNKAESEAELKQKQEAAQIGGAKVVSVAEIDKIISKPELKVQSGDVKLDGNKQEVMVFAPQMANAGPYVDGDIEQEAKSGEANTFAVVIGDVKSEGGFAGASQRSENKSETEFGKQCAACGADLTSIGGDTGKAEGGNGGDILGLASSRGGFNLALAESEARGGEAEGGDAEDARASTFGVAVGVAEAEGGSGAGGPTSTDGDSIAANLGGFARGGSARSGVDQDQGANGGAAGVGGATGYGGAAASGAGGAGGQVGFTPTATQNQTNGANTQSAQGTATGGTANGGAATGHWVQGGTSGDSANLVSMNGGIATNNLTVSPAVSGNVTGSSGQVCNDGSATSNVTPTFNQGGTATNNQTQTTGQTGTSTSSTGAQNATGGAAAVTAGQTVSSGEQEARASNSSSVEIEGGRRPN